MCNLSIQVPEEILLCLNETEQGLAAYTKKILAMHLYEKHQISLGYGAELADMSEEDFIYELGKSNISIFHFNSEEEFQKELSNA